MTADLVTHWTSPIQHYVFSVGKPRPPHRNQLFFVDGNIGRSQGRWLVPDDGICLCSSWRTGSELSPTFHLVDPQLFIRNWGLVWFDDSSLSLLSLWISYIPLCCPCSCCCLVPPPILIEVQCGNAQSGHHCWVKEMSVLWGKGVDHTVENFQAISLVDRGQLWYVLHEELALYDFPK